MLNSPWKLALHAKRLADLPRIRAAFFLHGVPWPEGARVFGMPIIQRHLGSRISIGSRVELRSSYASNPLAPHHPVVLSTRSRDAELCIGDDCGFTGSSIVAMTRIEIGDRVLLGANTVVVDTDFHPLSPSERRVDTLAGKSAPVALEDDVFVGTGAIILKGVTVGRGAVIGAGAVVSKDVEAGSIVAGNPARRVGRV